MGLDVYLYKAKKQLPIIWEDDTENDDGYLEVFDELQEVEFTRWESYKLWVELGLSGICNRMAREFEQVFGYKPDYEEFYTLKTKDIKTLVLNIANIIFSNNEDLDLYMELGLKLNKLLDLRSTGYNIYFQMTV